MAVGDTSDRHDRVGVAVVSYKMPQGQTPAETLRNAHRIRQMIEGLKLGLPDLDLVVFPPDTTDGVGRAADAPATPSEVLQVLSLACRNAQVWGVFSMALPDPSMALLDDKGQLVQVWRGATACAPAPGPRGLKLGLVMAQHDRIDTSAWWQEARRLGAELVVHCQPGTALGELGAQALAHHTYVALACATDHPAQPSTVGRACHSAIIGFDGSVLAECGDQAYAVCHAELSRRQLHEAPRDTHDAQHGRTARHALTSATHDPPSPPAAPAPALAQPPAMP